MYYIYDIYYTYVYVCVYIYIKHTVSTIQSQPLVFEKTVLGVVSKATLGIKPITHTQ
jgi:hypothetical protein